MDGDAWGSLGWLYLVLQKMWKNIKAINDEKVPDSLSFLGNTDIIEPNIDVADFDPDIIISLDAADLARLGKSYETWKKVFTEKPLIVLDHHISNPGFGDINLIDIDASSTCELVVFLLWELSLEQYITPTAATFFYTGLQTDTNMYATSNTTPRTLQIWAKLIELGADFRLPIEKCFREKTPNQIALWKVAYASTHIMEKKWVSYSILREKDLQDAGIPLEKVSEYLKWFINETLINIVWVNIAFLLYPLGKWKIKCSMRSKDGYDVNAICQKFWGGGHVQAAGFENEADIEEIKKMLLEEIKKSL